MQKCIAIGRALPERVNMSFGPVSTKFDARDVKGSGTAFADYSQISVHLEFDRDYNNLYHITSIAKSIVSPITNYIAFTLPGAYSVVFDMVIDVDQRKHHPISVSEPFFNEPRSAVYTFNPRKSDESVLIPVAALYDSAAARALEELSNALQRPHMTPMYCRFAIETVRSSFDTDEARGWERLRTTLNIKRETIDSFWSLAADQRHGRTIELDWKQRKSCLEIAWEVTNRFLLHKADPQGVTFEPL